DYAATACFNRRQSTSWCLVMRCSLPRRQWSRAPRHSAVTAYGQHDLCAQTRPCQVKVGIRGVKGRSPGQQRDPAIFGTCATRSGICKRPVQQKRSPAECNSGIQAHKSLICRDPTGYPSGLFLDEEKPVSCAPTPHVFPLLVPAYIDGEPLFATQKTPGD